MDPEVVGNALAPVNALLNLSAAVFLVAGWLWIRRRDVRRHRTAMIAAVGASALFLVFYVVRFSLTGTHRFAGEGLARVAYLTILGTHIVLAVVIVPLVLRLLYLAYRGRFRAHRRLARWTFPVWLYVSVTGIAVYVMLYHVWGWS